MGKMTPTLSPDIALEVERYAHNLGFTSEEYLLRFGHLLAEERTQLLPHGEWERKLASIPRHTGIVLMDEDLSSEGIYD